MQSDRNRGLQVGRYGRNWPRGALDQVKMRNAIKRARQSCVEQCLDARSGVKAVRAAKMSNSACTGRGGWMQESKEGKEKRKGRSDGKGKVRKRRFPQDAGSVGCQRTQGPLGRYTTCSWQQAQLFSAVLPLSLAVLYCSVSSQSVDTNGALALALLELQWLVGVRGGAAEGEAKGKKKHWARPKAKETEVSNGGERLSAWARQTPSLPPSAINIAYPYCNKLEPPWPSAHLSLTAHCTRGTPAGCPHVLGRVVFSAYCSLSLIFRRSA